MKGNYREKHCFTKTINGIEHFFAAYNGQSVEIDLGGAKQATGLRISTGGKGSYNVYVH